MKAEIEKRPATGFPDHLALAVTTFGVGYLPFAPGTWGSIVGVLIYLGFGRLHSIWNTHAATAHSLSPAQSQAIAIAAVLVLFVLFSLLGVWAAGRATSLLGNLDPPQAVIDEIIGQFITFFFVPFAISWPLVVAGFLLFRLFDIWKPYPIDHLQILPGGIGVCADDILAGAYAAACLAALYAITLLIW